MDTPIATPRVRKPKPPPVVMTVTASAWMPDGTPAPSILTEDQAAEFLRLRGPAKRWHRTLMRYRELRRLVATPLGMDKHYHIEDLQAFAESPSRESAERAGSHGRQNGKTEEPPVEVNKGAIR